MGLALADLLTAETISAIRARIRAQLVADGFPADSWAPSAVGGPENLRLDMAAGGVGVYMSPRIKAIVAGRLLPLAADDESGPWLSALGARFYGLQKRPATKTVRNIGLYSVGSGGTYTFNPGDLWVKFDATGNRYVSITGGQFSPANVGPPSPGFPGNPLMLQFEAENAGSSYSDGTGPVTLVTARAGVRAISIAPSDYTAATVSGPSSGSVSAVVVTGPGSPPASIRIAIRISGDLGTAQFAYSVDGGGTWSGNQALGPSFTLGRAQLTFANGGASPSFIVGDIFTMLLGEPILQRGRDAETDDLYRRRCVNRWPSLSSVPVAATVELWAQEASPEVTRVSVDADPNTPGGCIVTIASSSGPASPAAQIAVEDYINARLLGYKGVPAPTTIGFNSPAETALVLSAQSAVIIARGVVRVPKAQIAAAQVAANNAWNAYLAAIPLGGQPGAVVEIARFAQILADAGAIDVPGAISQLTFNGSAADIIVPNGYVTVPPDGATLLTQVSWIPA